MILHVKVVTVCNDRYLDLSTRLNAAVPCRDVRMDLEHKLLIAYADLFNHDSRIIFSHFGKGIPIEFLKKNYL